MLASARGFVRWIVVRWDIVRADHQVAPRHLFPDTPHDGVEAEAAAPPLLDVPPQGGTVREILYVGVPIIVHEYRLQEGSCLLHIYVLLHLGLVKPPGYGVEAVRRRGAPTFLRRVRV